MSGFLDVTDREEGLVIVRAGTLLDGNPSNMERLLMRGGQVYTVTNTPTGRPLPADTGLAVTLRRWWDSMVR